MAVNSGFSKIISCRLGNILAMGDWSRSSTRTAIAVRTKASEDVRYILGMREVPLQITVVAGTDPEDEDSVDAYSFFKTMFDGKVVENLTIDEVERPYICDSFEESFPLDELQTATVSLKLSANEASSSSSSSSSNGD